MTMIGRTSRFSADIAGRAAVVYSAAAMALCLGGAAARAGTCADGRYTVCETFDSPWTGTSSPDGLWRINGPWQGTGNFIDPALTRIVPNGPSESQVRLSVASEEKRGSEIQSLAGYNYGYYETRLRISPTPGVCASFFWIQKPNYGPLEWDIEFLTDEFRPETGAVHFTLHPSNATYRLALPFNPSKAYHRYGFLWTPGKIVFTVDGNAGYTFEEADLKTAAKGFIMVNALTGIPNWCNGPPKVATTSEYNWIGFSAGATSIIQP